MATSNLPPQLETANAPEPVPGITPPRAVGEGYLQCDFCECKLTKLGEVYQVSAKAREYRDANEKHAKQVEKLQEEISRLQEEIRVKQSEIARLTPSNVGSGSGSKFL